MTDTTSCVNHFMQRAIELAKQGRFTTTPNPNVGCVIVKNGEIVGEGYHHKAGEPHAEVYALKMAGEKAKDADVYVTLEPCSHFGRTPPCADALIQANVKSVYIAMRDPNPNVAGKGIKRLEDAGIHVEVDILADLAESLNKGFLKRMRTGFPYVQLKLATSLDGKIAMASGESQWITSPFSRQDVQQFRAQASAILSSRKTVQFDNASLTVRWHELPLDIQAIYPQNQIRQPYRVILDSQNKLTGEEKIFKQAGETWIVRKQPIMLNTINTQLLIEDSTAKYIDLRLLLKQLAQKQVNTLWVEAGAHLAGALIEQELVDELIIYMAPKLLGHNAKDAFVLPDLTQLAKAPCFNIRSVTQIGDDIRLILTK